jgi:tetratricopeptide (TPR) repeat protein
MRGVVYAQQGSFGKSEEAFEQASRLNANREITAMGLTLTLQQDGRLNEAVEVLRRQLEKNPRHAELNYMLAQALVKQGIEPGQPVFAEAVQALQVSIEANPESARSRAALGQLYLKKGDTEQAIQELQRAVEIDSSDRSASYQLMLAYRKAGRHAEAAELMEKVRGMVDDSRREELEKNRYRLVRGEPGQPR